MVDYNINAPSDASSIWPREEVSPTGGRKGGESVDPMHRKMDEERHLSSPSTDPVLKKLLDTKPDTQWSDRSWSPWQHGLSAKERKRRGIQKMMRKRAQGY